MKQIKIIQSRLTSRGVSASYGQIRDYVGQLFPNKETLSEEELVNVVDYIKVEHGEKSLTIRREGIEKSSERQVEKVQEISQQMSIDLPVEQIKEIANKINWLATSRSEMVARIREAITAYIDHQISSQIAKDKEELKLVLDGAEKTLKKGFEENNRDFSQSVQDFCGRMEEMKESFRSTEREILDFLKTPERSAVN